MGARLGGRGERLPRVSQDAESERRAVIIGALKRAGYNRTKAARLLGLSYSTLHGRMNSLGIRSTPTLCLHDDGEILDVLFTSSSLMEAAKRLLGGRPNTNDGTLRSLLSVELQRRGIHHDFTTRFRRDHHRLQRVEGAVLRSVHTRHRETLDHEDAIDATAARFGVGRHTMKMRLRQVGAFTGMRRQDWPRVAAVAHALWGHGYTKKAIARYVGLTDTGLAQGLKRMGRPLPRSVPEGVDHGAGPRRPRWGQDVDPAHVPTTNGHEPTDSDWEARPHFFSGKANGSG